MPKPNLRDLTLRDKFKEASRVTREFTEHVEQGFLPRCKQLGRLVRPKFESSKDYELDTEAGIEDITIRNEVARVLESENYTDELFQDVRIYLESIDQEIDHIIMGIQ
ncbi:MAG: hypothetical protein KDA84_27425 [Planctomycetaceae bacterium]|nr:hypothetical protein [Planctomycetaceae bacterium]